MARGTGRDYHGAVAIAVNLQVPTDRPSESSGSPGMQTPLRAWSTSCAGLLLLVLASPSRADEQASSIELFETRIRPLLVERCYSCHSSEAKKIKGELRLDSRAVML